MPLTYPGGPSVELTATGLAGRISGQAPSKVVALVGSAPKGNDHFGIMSISDAITYYGSFSSVGSAGYSIPRALYLLSSVSQLQGALPFNVGIMAAGKVSATASFGTGGVATSTGKYAGTKGSTLSLVFTCVSTVITSITVTDSALGGAIVQQFLAIPNGPYDLTTNASVMNAINSANALDNPNSVLRVTTAGTVLPTTTTTITFSGGTPNDGSGVAAANATIDTLLAESLAYDVDYIVPLFDVSDVEAKISTHRAACATELLYRRFVMGPKIAATFAGITSTGSPYIPTLSDRYNVWGVPPLQIFDPILSAVNVVDPFYFAVVMAGLKAAFPVQATLDEMRVPGVQGFASWTDHGPYLTKADLKALGLAGFATAYKSQKKPGIYVADNITAGAFSLDGQNINPFYQMSIRDQDDLVSSTAVATARQFRGQAAPGTITMAATIQEAIKEALNGLAILVRHTEQVTPLSGNPFNYSVLINYVPQWPVLDIAITTSFSFS